MRSAIEFGKEPELLIRDRDDKFGTQFDRVAEGVGIRVVRTAVRTSVMNAVSERFFGGARRECLDHVLVLGERHLKHVVDTYCFKYFNRPRPHQGLDKKVPISRPRSVSDACKEIMAYPILGGLYHDYQIAA